MATAAAANRSFADIFVSLAKLVHLRHAVKAINRQRVGVGLITKERNNFAG
jgi:hypothetical protein